jgi:LysR family transcriptional regulator of gallate degradation
MSFLSVKPRETGSMSDDSRVSLRSVRAVLAVLDEGSISRAAPVLFVSQPALSRLIKVAEERLGVRLFERRSDGVVPNGEASSIFERLRRVKGQLERASAELALLPEMRQVDVPLYRHLALRHLRALVSTVDHGSATAAAEVLGQSTTAVARAIRDIEALVKVPLFDRSAGRLLPTPAGLCLVRHAKLALHELRYVREEVVARSGAIVGHVAIGSTPLPRTLLVPEAVGRLSSVHPGLQFSIVEGPYDTLLSGLLSGDLDVIVGALREPAPVRGVREEILFQAPLSFVVRRGHPLAGKARVEMEDLVRCTWVVPRRGTPARGHFEAFFRAAGLAPPRRLIECSSLVATRALLLRNDWLSILSRHQIYYEEHFGILEVLPIDLAGTSRAIGVTVRADTTPAPATASFVAGLRAVSEQISWETGAASRAFIPVVS